VFLALPAGRYTDRKGLRAPVRVAVGASVLGAGLAVAWPVFPVLCVTALLTGGATGIASIALQRHVGRAAQNSTQLKQVFSWLAIGPAVSNFLGPFSAGLLIDHAGFRAAFFALALLPLATWWLTRRVQELQPAVVHRQAGARTWDLLRNPAMSRLMWVNWLLSSCWDVHTFVVPVLGHERGFSASVIGAILGSFAIAAALVRVVLPSIAERLAEWAVIAGAMFATGLIFALYPFLRTPLAMGAASVVLGVVLGCVQPMIMSTLHQITPENRQGEALALRLMVINGSSVAMPILFGATGAVIGVSWLFWIVGGLVGAGSRLAVGLKR
jgi:MFS family permease